MGALALILVLTSAGVYFIWRFGDQIEKLLDALHDHLSAKSLKIKSDIQQTSTQDIKEVE